MDSRITFDVVEAVANVMGVGEDQIICTNSLKASIASLLIGHGSFDMYVFDERHMLGLDCAQCIISLLDDDFFQLPQGGDDTVEIKVIGGTRKISSSAFKNQLLNYPKWYVALWALSNYHVYDDDMLGRMTVDLLYIEIEHEMGNNPDFAWLRGVL